MDNDKWIIKKSIELARRCMIQMDYIGYQLRSENKGNKIIENLITSAKPVMIARLGAVEMHCVSKWMSGKDYSLQDMEQALYAAGIFPNSKDILDRFCEIYTESMRESDFIGVWRVSGEKKAIKKYCNNPILAPSRAIEPYYYEDPWSKVLKDKKILIIHPFIQSIEKQIKNREKIWEDSRVLPKFASATFIKAVQSNAGARPCYVDWFEALESMKREIDKADFDIAIIGAGAYGLPLAAYVKRIGKQSVQMSGATQILFGIMGKRWEDKPQISKFFNSYWIRPSLDETPPNIEKVEGGSYW